MSEPPVARFLRTLSADGPSDAELLQRFAEARDQAAFELLVWRHAGMVQATARAVLRDRHLAEDAAQATFLALARHAGRVRANPSGWLCRTARRAALATRRAVPVRGRSACGVAEPPSPNGDGSPDADDLAVLHEELARLPDRYRLPVLLCLMEGLTHPAAAARLGWPVGTVAGRLSRAKALLRDRLTRRGVVAGLTLAPAVGGGWVSATVTAATTFSAGGVAGVSPSVILLAKGLVRTMTVTKWASAAGLFAATAVLTGGLVAVGQPPPVEKGVPGATAGAVPSPPFQVEPTKPNPGKPEDPQRAADYAQRLRSLNSLEHIAIGLSKHHEAHGHLPADTRDKSGKPLLSWRVAILPYLFPPRTDWRAAKFPFADLYRKFNQDEPWDGPTNKPLLAQMPGVYRLGFQPPAATDTYYQGFAGPGTVFEPGRKIGYDQITDGETYTLAVAEVGPAVPWTKPADVPYDPAKPFPAVTWPFRNLINVTHLSSPHQYVPTVPELYLRQTISRSGGEVLTGGWGGGPPRFTAETPQDKAELAKLQAEVARQLAEAGELAAGSASLEELATITSDLRLLLKELKPPAK